MILIPPGFERLWVAVATSGTPHRSMPDPQRVLPGRPAGISWITIPESDD
jgi:hypothetical protein